MVGLLSYTAQPDLACLYSLTASIPHAIMAGWHLVMSARYGDSILPRARCSILGEFARSDCEKLLMVDDDVSWKPEHLIRILSHDEDFVGGVYPKKKDEVEYPVTYSPDIDSKVDDRGLVEVKGVPGGFLCISRNAAWKMIERYAEKVYWDASSDTDCWALWDFYTRPEGWHGEDFRFCDRWRSMGGKVYADTIPLSHAGRKVWEGNFGEWIKTRRDDNPNPIEAR